MSKPTQLEAGRAVRSATRGVSVLGRPGVGHRCSGWRLAVPPAHTRLASPYDTDARWVAEGTELFWRGYKLHLTETCEDPAEDTDLVQRSLVSGVSGALR
jgi:hypothetical protein